MKRQKTFLLALVLLTTGTIVNAQTGRIGINTETPAATLDVVGKPDDTSKLDGVIPPRLTATQLNKKTYTAAQTGAIVEVTAVAEATTGQTEQVSAPGIYLFNGTKWESINQEFVKIRNQYVPAETDPDDGTQYPAQEVYGWSTRYRLLNPTFYGKIGASATDFSMAYSPATGDGYGATGAYSFATGFVTKASGGYSTALGLGNVASGIGSISVGANNQSTGDSSFTEGSSNIASGLSSHAEGSGNKAQGANSHAEGEATFAIGSASHTEGGFGTRAVGTYSHAGGVGTTANGWASFAHGWRADTSSAMEVAFGAYPVSITAKINETPIGTDVNGVENAQLFVPDTETKYFSIGNGKGRQVGNQHDAFAVFKNGGVTFGNVYTGNVQTPKLGQHIADENGDLNHYDGTVWKKYISVAFSGSAPATAKPGDMYYNTSENKYYAFDGSTWHPLW